MGLLRSVCLFLTFSHRLLQMCHRRTDVKLILTCKGHRLNNIFKYQIGKITHLHQYGCKYGINDILIRFHTCHIVCLVTQYDHICQITDIRYTILILVCIILWTGNKLKNSYNKMLTCIVLWNGFLQVWCLGNVVTMGNGRIVQIHPTV